MLYSYHKKWQVENGIESVHHGQLTLPFNWYSEIELSWTEGNIDEPVMATDCNPSLLFVDK